MNRDLWRTKINEAIAQTEAALISVLSAGFMPVEMAGTLSRAADDLRDAIDGLKRFVRKLDREAADDEAVISAVDPFLPLVPEDGECTPLITPRTLAEMRE